MAARFHAAEPWQRLLDCEMILAGHPAWPLPNVCIVMGRLGEFMSLTVLLSGRGLDFFRRLQSGEKMDFGNFFAEQHSVRVEYASRRELTKDDRELLKATGYPTKPKEMVPIFRTIRPGYHPWYVTEDEAAILTECMRSVLAFLDHLPAHATYWNREGFLPLVEPPEYRVRMAAMADPGAGPESAPPLNERRLNRILAARFPRGCVLEVDQFYAPAKIGRRNERPSCMRGVLALDAETAFAYPPQIVGPDEPTGIVLAEAVLAAVEAGKFLPRAIHVRSNNSQTLLAPLAAALGVPIKVRAQLPAFEFCKNELIRAMT
jgi:hypothetical protein